ncbi:antitoxin domain protein [Mycobacteroides abscessus 6G-0728-R]|nr:MULTISPECIES: hypothetical protein [Mycobacteriaceae]EIU51675.1 antitoxin domain protein [Mycobacteroides abscessus 6G-0125-S]EIU64205.1 antitoxin domain protein [Mycobacteroides abscessus 6G-0728-S]EIU74766.1 antitoxin domain protein [Mycobacteroides abscessus 6G-1108]EIV03071.1 antitoxin domain protein [Mycobacteroides abscessus 6G-0728-R]
MNASDAADGQSIERRLRDEHLRIALETYTAHTVPTLDIDAYAAKVFEANKAAGL